MGGASGTQEENVVGEVYSFSGGEETRDWDYAGGTYLDIILFSIVCLPSS